MTAAVFGRPRRIRIGKDIFSGQRGRRACAVVIVGQVPATLAYKGAALFSSDEFAEKYWETTFILFTDESEPSTDLNDPANYERSSTGVGRPARIGDADANGVINAQDALDVISTWTRPLPAPDDAGILSMNVTGDSVIDTSDAISVMEFFISGIEFPVLGK